MSDGSAKLFLEHCPVCGYSLEGLPVEHRCPECGFAFDRRWRVFRPRLIALFWTSPLLPWMFMFFGLMTILVVVSGVWPAATWAGIIGIAPATVVMWFLLSPPRWVALTPSGLRTYRGTKWLAEDVWRRGERAQWLSMGVVHLGGPNGTRNVRLLSPFIGQMLQDWEIIAAINRYPHKEFADAA